MARQNQIKIKDSDIQIPEQTLKKIDGAIVDVFDEKINIYVVENNNKIKVPVYISTPERWSNIKKERFLRDKNKKVILPLCFIKRNNIEVVADKNQIPNDYNKISIIKKLSQDNTYLNSRWESKLSPIYEIIDVTIPLYLNITYTVMLWTRYIESMNMIIEQILLNHNKGNIIQDTFSLKWSFDSIADESNVEDFSDELRLITNSFDFNLEGLFWKKDSKNKNFRKILTPSKITVTEKLG